MCMKKEHFSNVDNEGYFSNFGIFEEHESNLSLYVWLKLARAYHWFMRSIKETDTSIINFCAQKSRNKISSEEKLRMTIKNYDAERQKSWKQSIETVTNSEINRSSCSKCFEVDHLEHIKWSHHHVDINSSERRNLLSCSITISFLLKDRELVISSFNILITTACFLYYSLCEIQHRLSTWTSTHSKS